MKVKLTDNNTWLDFSFQHSEQSDVEVLLALKKVLPSVMELILPVLNEQQQALDKIEWESTTADLHMLQKFYQSWGVLELRLKALMNYKNTVFVKQLIAQAQTYRQQLAKQSTQQYSTVQLDYLFLLYLHGMIDSELVNIGEHFYSPTFQKLWQDEMGHLALLKA